MRGHGHSQRPKNGIGRGRGALAPAWLTRKNNENSGEQVAKTNRGRSRDRERYSSAERVERNAYRQDRYGSPPRHHSSMRSDYDERNRAPTGDRHAPPYSEAKRNRQSDFVPPLYSIWKGSVANIKDFGCFVRIPVENGENVDGLVHISQISETQQRIEDITEFVQVGTPVYVKVMEHRTHPETNRVQLSLSMKYVSQGSGQDLDPNQAKHEMDLVKKRDLPKQTFRSQQMTQAVHKDVLDFSAKKSVNCKYSGTVYEMVEEDPIYSFVNETSAPASSDVSKPKKHKKRKHRSRSHHWSRKRSASREKHSKKSSRKKKHKKHKSSKSRHRRRSRSESR